MSMIIQRFDFRKLSYRIQLITHGIQQPQILHTYTSYSVAHAGIQYFKVKVIHQGQRSFKDLNFRNLTLHITSYIGQISTSNCVHLHNTELPMLVGLLQGQGHSSRSKVIQNCNFRNLDIAYNFLHRADINFKMCKLTKHIELHMLKCSISRLRLLVKVKGNNLRKL